MKEFKLTIDSDLSEASFEQAIFDMKLSFPMDIKLRINFCNFLHGGKIATYTSMVKGIKCEVEIDLYYSDDEWSVSCQDKILRSKGA